MSNKNDLTKIKQLLDSAESSILEAKELLFQSEIGDRAKLVKSEDDDTIEGIFNGEKLISAAGTSFDVPANYASKSKLVSGDVMKLTILDDGSFLFKQIGPVERKKLIGKLSELAPGKYSVSVGKNQYRVLSASVTYFKAMSGDQLTISVPKDQPAEWAAVENKIN